MTTKLLRDYEGRLVSIHWDSSSGRRTFWIGDIGFGLGSNIVYNCHWYDLFKRPWERYSIGEYRIAYFFGNFWRGLQIFLYPKKEP